MQIFERILIVTDNTSFSDAHALQTMLEDFNLTVHMQRLLRYRQAAEFFQGDYADSYDYVILCFHGMGKTEETIRMEVQVLEQKDGDYTARDGWDWKGFEIRPADVPELFKSVRGRHVIAMACGGGREQFGRAFLQAGCQSYTGFDLGTSEGPNWCAFLVFVINLFYHLLAEVRSGDGRKRSMAQAVKLASGVDTEYRWGTGGYRIYEPPTNG